MSMSEFIETYKFLGNGISFSEIWEMSNGGINKIIKQSGRRFAVEFSRDFGIPHRTLQRWQKDDTAPIYVLAAIAYIVYTENEQA